jgi:hypothetical protein
MAQDERGILLDPDDQVYATTDHDFIRDWTAGHSGMPAMYRRIGQIGQGDLVINFPGDGSDEPLVDISWADFFQRFEDQNLAFVYQESDTGAENERFYGLIDRKVIED